MSKKLISLSLFAAATVLLQPASSEATFSIVAVDTATGAIGGAGASCIDNSQIINDIIESIGAVHTQAWWLEQNQDNAHALLAAGLTPDSIIAWLVANDVEGRPGKRQYGVVTLAGPGSSAAHTGAQNDSWAGHHTGFGYAIQGNILLGPQIIDSMEFVFLNTSGPLEDRLMAALEAAKVPGADNRCLTSGKSAISGFIKVVMPGDGPTPYLYEVVPTTFGSTDPIDSLRLKFDNWKQLQAAHPDSSVLTVTPMILHGNGTATADVTIIPINSRGRTPYYMDSVTLDNSGAGVLSGIIDNGDGTYSATLTAPSTYGEDTISAGVGSYGFYTELNEKRVVVYFACGNIDNDVGPAGPVDVADLTYLVGYLFGGGAAPPILQAANVDGVIGPGGPIDVADLTYLVTYLFASGPAPVCE